MTGAGLIATERLRQVMQTVSSNNYAITFRHAMTDSEGAQP